MYNFFNQLNNKFIAMRYLLPALMAMNIDVAKAQTLDYGRFQDLFNEPVTTSATGKPQKASDVPVAMEIITSDDIKRSGVTTIPEILERTTGVSAWLPTRSSADVGLRGQNTSYNPSMLVLLNGRQVYNDSFSYTDWPTIPVQLEEIKQIEVIKGANSALYGFNAVSGVVNIITFNPKYDNISNAGLIVGTGDYQKAYGIKTAKISDNVSLRLSSSVEKFDEFSKESKTNYAQQSAQFQNVYNRKLMADSIVTISDKTQLRVEGSYVNNADNESPNTYFAVPTDQTIWSAKTTLASDTSLGMVEANLYNNNSYVTFGGRLNTYQSNDVTVFQLQDLFKVGVKHTFRIQGECRYNDLRSGVSIGPGAKLSYETVALGAMWNWSITPTVELTNAVRIDSLNLDRKGPLPTTVPYTVNSAFDETITDYSLNNGIVWKATNVDSLRASYARGIQAPSLSSLGTLYRLQPGVFLAGLPQQDPVVVNNYEVGYDRIIEKIAGKFRSSVFYKKTEDMTVTNGHTYLSGSSLILQFGNIGSSETKGIELGLQGKIGENWDWDASYVYQDTTDNFISSAIFPSNQSLRYEDTVPHNVFKGHVGYTKDAWQTDVYGEAATKFDAVQTTGLSFNKVGLGGYYTLGGRVAYTFENNVTVGLQGSDLNHSRVQDSYGLENERRLYLTLSKSF